MEELLESGENLFGDQFMKSIHKQAKALGKTSKQLLMLYLETFQETTTSPFQGAPRHLIRGMVRSEREAIKIQTEAKEERINKTQKLLCPVKQISLDNSNSQRKIIFSWKNTPGNEKAVERIKNEPKLPSREKKNYYIKIG